jgi:hypothetical protein
MRPPSPHAHRAASAVLVEVASPHLATLRRRHLTTRPAAEDGCELRGVREHAVDAEPERGVRVGGDNGAQRLVSGTPAPGLGVLLPGPFQLATWPIMASRFVRISATTDQRATTPETTGTSHAAYEQGSPIVAIWSSQRAIASSRLIPSCVAIASLYPSRHASQMAAHSGRGTRSVSPLAASPAPPKCLVRGIR